MISLPRCWKMYKMFFLAGDYYSMVGLLLILIWGNPCQLGLQFFLHCFVFVLFVEILRFGFVTWVCMLIGIFKEVAENLDDEKVNKNLY